MASNAPKQIADKIALYVERSGIDPALVNVAYFERALIEFENAARIVREDIERNDEPAAAFHVPSEVRS